MVFIILIWPKNIVFARFIELEKSSVRIGISGKFINHITDIYAKE